MTVHRSARTHGPLRGLGRLAGLIALRERVEPGPQHPQRDPVGIDRQGRVQVGVGASASRKSGMSRIAGSGWDTMWFMRISVDEWTGARRTSLSDVRAPDQPGTGAASPWRSASAGFDGEVAGDRERRCRRGRKNRGSAGLAQADDSVRAGGAMDWRCRYVLGRLDMICIDAHLGDPEGSCDDEEAESVAVGEQSLEAGRQDDTFRLRNVHPVRGQRGKACDADLRADHQGDFREAPNCHEGAGKSVGGTTASPGRTRSAAMRKRFRMAEPLGS